ncbi:MAG: hypothetical protein PVJ57_12020 [Phycisphaerae bacterium]|jgi:hypothetical protein
MNWHDPDNIWAQSLQRRIRRLWLGYIGRVLGAIVPVGIFVWGITWKGGALAAACRDELLFLLVATGVVVPAIIFAQLGRRLHIARTVLREVPKHDGYICPRCRRPVPEDVPAGKCPKCRRPYVRADLPSYWLNYVFTPLRLAPPLLPPVWNQRLQRLLAILREHILVTVALCVALFTVAFLLMHWLGGVSLTGLLFLYGPMLLAVVFLCTGLIYLNRYRRRTGNSRHCVACGYQQAPSGLNPRRCPECGMDWSLPGGMIIGKPSRQPHHLWLAVAFLAAAALPMILMMLSPASVRGLVLRTLPTGALINDAVADDGFTRAEWSELLGRRLSPEQRRQLAVGLLDKRLEQDYLDMVQGGWLWGQVSASLLPPDVTERYYGEMLDVRIDAPATAVVGEPLHVHLSSTYRRSRTPFGLDPAVYFGGFFFGDDPAPLGQRERGEHAKFVASGLSRIQASITPTQPGPLRVRAVLYFAVGPNLTAWKGEWHDDETATLPSAATWSRRIELEKTIDVHR